MSEPASAVIIPFPMRITVPAISPAAAPAEGASRVAVASDALAAALADQHEALVAWQSALDDLSFSLRNLGGNLQTLETALAQNFTL